MQSLNLQPQKAVSVAVTGKTLSIINDPSVNETVNWGGFIIPPFRTIGSGVILVGLDAIPLSISTADAVVPPFTCATIPIPAGTTTVWLLYLGLFTATGGAQLSPGASVEAGIAFSDAEGPLAILPLGSVLPFGVGQSPGRPAQIPIDTNTLAIPPGPATTVYDQDLAGGRNGPLLRPHLAPSASSTALWLPAAANTLYPATLTGSSGWDPFNPSSGLNVMRAIRRIIISNSVPARLVIGTNSLTIAGGAAGLNEVLRVTLYTPGCWTFDFAEGLAPDFAGPGQWKYYSGTAGAAFDVTVLHG
jgi:hypothetical protein